MPGRQTIFLPAASRPPRCSRTGDWTRALSGAEAPNSSSSRAWRASASPNGRTFSREVRSTAIWTCRYGCRHSSDRVGIIRRSGNNMTKSSHDPPTIPFMRTLVVESRRSPESVPKSTIHILHLNRFWYTHGMADAELVAQICRDATARSRSAVLDVVSDPLDGSVWVRLASWPRCRRRWPRCWPTA
jgi:hypothetical protein